MLVSPLLGVPPPLIPLAEWTPEEPLQKLRRIDTVSSDQADGRSDPPPLERCQPTPGTAMLTVSCTQSALYAETEQENASSRYRDMHLQVHVHIAATMAAKDDSKS